MTLPKPTRTFLVVVDESLEMPVALEYASWRAVKTHGQVAMLRIIPREENHGLASVAALMREEALAEAQDLLTHLAAEVAEKTGVKPIFIIREGIPSDEVVQFINSDPTVSVLVLAAGMGSEGPGPLVTYLVGRAIGKMRVPLTIVPGNLSSEQICAIT